MSGVLERRREYLRLMRQFTLDKGFFTVTDIQHATSIPRSTAQDWVNRLAPGGLCAYPRGETRAECGTLCGDQCNALECLPTDIHDHRWR